jgi:hypothetical protein
VNIEQSRAIIRARFRRAVVSARLSTEQKQAIERLFLVEIPAERERLRPPVSYFSRDGGEVTYRAALSLRDEEIWKVQWQGMARILHPDQDAIFGDELGALETSLYQTGLIDHETIWGESTSTQ